MGTENTAATYRLARSAAFDTIKHGLLLRCLSNLAAGGGGGGDHVAVVSLMPLSESVSLALGPKANN